MDGLVQFFTDKGGAFAAIVAVVGLAAVLVGLVRPTLAARRAKAEARPRLEMSAVRVAGPPPYSEAGEVTFELMNAGGGKAVLRDLLLTVSAHGPLEMPRMTETAAPVPQFTFTVTLSPEVAQYDVRRKEFGSPAPHSYEAGEVEAIRVELRTTRPQWYEFEVIVVWYDVAKPSESVRLVSPLQRIEFEPGIEDVV